MKDNNNESKWSKRDIGALWTKSSKDNSQKYLTGHIQTSLEGKIDIVVFSNKDKKNDKAPDFRIYISEKKSPEPNALSQSGNTESKKAAKPEPVLEEDNVL